MRTLGTLLLAALLAVPIAGGAGAAPGTFTPRAHAVAAAHKVHLPPVYAPAAKGIAAGPALPAGVAAKGAGSAGLHAAALSYAAGHRSALLADVMRGYGPDLAALARRLGCPGTAVPRLALRARSTLAPLRGNASPRRVTEALRSAIRTDSVLAALCR